MVIHLYAKLNILSSYGIKNITFHLKKVDHEFSETLLLIKKCIYSNNLFEVMLLYTTIFHTTYNLQVLRGMLEKCLLLYV